MNPEAETSLLTLSARTRPTRVAFLVDTADSSLPYLDKVFGYSVGYWGGRFHGVFPVTEGKVLDAWWPALQHLDPDIVVTNTDLLPACLDRIERSILPAHYLGLGASERDRCNDPFVPIYGLQLLDICAIPQIMWADRGPLQDPLFIRFKRRQPVDDIHRVILRNFGALHDDVQTTAAFRDLPLQDIDDRALTLDALFSQLTEIGNRAVLPVDLACYAAAFPANLEYSPSANEFHLTIGDSCLDAFYHWNRVFCAKFGHGRASLWLPSAAAQDDRILESVAAWIRRSFWQSGSERTGAVVSFSLDEPELRRLCDRFSANRTIYLRPVRMRSESYSFPNGQPPHSPSWEPSLNLLGRPSINKYSWQRQLPFSHGHSLVDIPRPPVAARQDSGSSWMVDLQLQFHPERYEYTNVRPDWTLPKRRGLAELFLSTTKCRVVAGGLPSLEVAGDLSRVALQIPSDRTIFRALLLESPYANVESIPRRAVRFKEIRTSDEGAILRGMLTLFGSLWHCGHQFAQPFWQAILSELAQAEPGHPDRWRTLKLLKQRFGNLRSEALRRRTDAEYWNAYTSFDEYIRREFDELVEQGVLQQGAELRCMNCGSFYWYNVRQLQPEVGCLGCRSFISLPTETEWSYRLNDLVANALRQTGTLATVQALYSLQDETRGGMFLFVPSQILADEYGGPSRLELDIVALAQNRFIIGEVKSSPSGFRQEDIDRAVAITKEFEPDELVLAAPGQDWPPDVLELIEDGKAQLASSHAKIRILKMQWR